eukprot:2408781-Rhodomonas_salina.1
MEARDDAIENSELAVQLDLSEEVAAAQNTQECEIVTLSRSSSHTAECTESLTASELTERDFIGDHNSTDRHNCILHMPDKPQDEFEKIQTSAEEIANADRVGGVGGVRGVVGAGGAGAGGEIELGGGSIYFDEPIEAQLTSLPKPLCSQL